MSLFKIAFANIKKRKSNYISFLAIILMSALMLSISLSLLLNTNSFYERKRLSVNSADIVINVPDYIFSQEIIDYLDQYELISDYQVNQKYISEIKYSKNPINRKQFAVSESSSIANLKINTITLIDEVKNITNNYIYLPLEYKYSGYKANELFVFETATFTYELTIVGFFEDVLQGASTMGIKNAYVDSKTFTKIKQDPSFWKGYNLYIQFDEIATSYLFATSFAEKFNLINLGGYIFDYEMAKMAHTLFPLIMAFVLIIVAAIILIVALIIVKFNINNSISEDIKSLGALKSIGYTSNQIMKSILIQFLILALIGSLIGVILGALSIGFVGNIISATSGLLWNSATFFIPIILTIFIICFNTVLITYLTARKSKTITPIVALRSGIKTHSFKKNHASLEKSKLNINISLAIKTFLNSLKSNITAFIVVLMFGFMTVFGITLYHNFVTDTKSFIKMIGMEPAHIQVCVYNEEDISILDDIFSSEEVESSARFDNYSAVSNGYTIGITVWEDITQKRSNSLIEGRYPIHDNEITLLASLKKVLDKNVGDIVHIEFKGVRQSYLVVGITQGVSSDATADMTLEGFKRLESNPILKLGYLYLDLGKVESNDQFISKLKLTYQAKVSIYNMEELINGTLVGLKDPVAIATYLITSINIATSVFVFFLLVSTIIRRRNKELGIMKAIGFTTKQIITQILLSFLPSIISGLIIGSILGLILTNPLFGMMFNGLGIAKAEFFIPISKIFIIQFILLLVCLITILLVSLKIKKIVPHKLITE